MRSPAYHGDDVQTASNALHDGHRASVGLIGAESTKTLPQGKGYADTLDIDGDAPLDAADPATFDGGDEVGP